jgi:hypothetical protein
MELKRVNTRAPLPLMIPAAAVRFNRLRRVVFKQSGVDFLSKCGDVSRTERINLKKDGVARRSLHRTGRAFDYDQTSDALVIVPEAINDKQYFRTHLLCADQTGNLGVKHQLSDYRGYKVDAFVFDFTAAAAIEGFERIPVLKRWPETSSYNHLEFWHYQYNPENLSWADAMLQVRNNR